MTKLGYLTLFVAILAVVGGYFLFFSERSTELALNEDGSVAQISDNMDNETDENNPESPVDTEINTEDLPDKVNVVLNTEKGDIELELYPTVAPKTVANFMLLAGQGFYDGTTFHRVIPEFMIQGGDPNSKDDDPSNDGRGGPGYTFEDEINPKALGLLDTQIAQLEVRGYKYDYDLKSLPVAVGSIAMANAGPNTNGSQFFIVTIKDQPHLNGLHTVFGKVTKGMDVVRSIQQGDEIEGVELPNQ